MKQPKTKPNSCCDQSRRRYLESRGPRAKDEPLGKVEPGERRGVPAHDTYDGQGEEERQPARHGGEAERRHDSVLCCYPATLFTPRTVSSFVCCNNSPTGRKHGSLEINSVRPGRTFYSRQERNKSVAATRAGRQRREARRRELPRWAEKQISLRLGSSPCDCIRPGLPEPSGLEPNRFDGRRSPVATTSRPSKSEGGRKRNPA